MHYALGFSYVFYNSELKLNVLSEIWIITLCSAISPGEKPLTSIKLDRRWHESPFGIDSYAVAGVV